MTNLREWAINNGLESEYNQYSADVDAMVDALEEQGLPSHGSTYEALLEGIRSCYPELFGEDGENPDDNLDPDKRAMIRNHKRYEKWERTEAARQFMQEHLPPEKYQEYLRTRFNS